MPPRKLRTVAEGEKAPTAKVPASLKEAVEMSERSLLVALRKKAAESIDAGPPAHALPPLIRQLRELDSEIRALDARAAEEEDEGAISADEAWDAQAL
jgi:hypothetical protein